jgi:DNA processing protein
MTPTATATPRVSRDEELHWIALKMVPGLGTRKAGLLIEKFSNPQSVFRASKSDLEGTGISASVAQSIASGCSFDDAVDQQQKAINTGVELVSINDPRYPPRLKEVYDPPVLLFARGRVELLQTLTLAVVGTRRPTPYGLAATTRLAAELAQAQLTIGSGMASGIDTAAHRAALGVKGNTTAVLGCGVDVVYPSENKKLASEIAANGLLISEFPMGSPPYPQNFPVRNRIIAGMSVGVLIVEGAQYSGSSITAKLAMEQGREVFAVPGNITSEMSWSPNLLIKQGAKLVQEWNDVIVELQPEDRRRLIVNGQREILGDEIAQLPEGPQAPLQKELLAKLKVDQKTSLDALLESLEFQSSSEVSAALFELEMLGLIKKLPGLNFVKVW